jgi:hypothetical protein
MMINTSSDWSMIFNAGISRMRLTREVEVFHGKKKRQMWMMEGRMCIEQNQKF